MLFVLFARSWWWLEREPPVELWLLVVAPLVVRVVLSVGQGFGGRRMGLMLGFVCGALWLALSLASHGLAPESAVGLAIVAVTAIGARFPRFGGGLLILAAEAAGLFVGPFGVGNAGGNPLVRVVVGLALPLPLLLAGVGLLAAARRAGEPEAEADDVATGG